MGGETDHPLDNRGWWPSCSPVWFAQDPNVYSISNGNLSLRCGFKNFYDQLDGLFLIHGDDEAIATLFVTRSRLKVLAVIA